MPIQSDLSNREGAPVRIEDREDFVDLVAQTVIDKIEEHERVESLVSLVVARVLAMQREEAQVAAALNGADSS